MHYALILIPIYLPFEHRIIIGGHDLSLTHSTDNLLAIIFRDYGEMGDPLSEG